MIPKNVQLCKCAASHLWTFARLLLHTASPLVCTYIVCYFRSVRGLRTLEYMMGFSERESKSRGSFRKKKALSAVMDADLELGFLDSSTAEAAPTMEHATTEVNVSFMASNNSRWNLILLNVNETFQMWISICPAQIPEKLWGVLGRLSNGHFKKTSSNNKLVRSCTTEHCGLIIWKSWKSVAISALIRMLCTLFPRLHPSFGSCGSVTDLEIKHGRASRSFYWSVAVTLMIPWFKDFGYVHMSLIVTRGIGCCPFRAQLLLLLLMPGLTDLNKLTISHFL